MQGQRAQGSKGSWFVWQHLRILAGKPPLHLSLTARRLNIFGHGQCTAQRPGSLWPYANLHTYGESFWGWYWCQVSMTSCFLWWTIVWIKLAYPQIERAKRLKRYRLKTKHDSCRLWKISTHSRFENNPASQLPDQSHHAAAGTATWDAVPDLQNATPFHMLIGFPIIFGLYKYIYIVYIHRQSIKIGILRIGQSIGTYYPLLSILVGE